MDSVVINTILMLESKANNPVSGEQPSKLKGRTDYSSLPIMVQEKTFFPHGELPVDMLLF